jgi:hypothetical protein
MRIRSSQSLSAIVVWGVVFVAAVRAEAWSYKEHVQLTRLAVARLLAAPDTDPALKKFLSSTTPTLSLADERQFMIEAHVGIEPQREDLLGLLWWVLVPDLEAGRRDGPAVEPFGVHERLLHYIDLELLNAPGQPLEYRDDLSGLPDRSLIPREKSDERLRRAGFLPFAVEHSSKQLIRAIRKQRIEPDLAVPGDDHALRWAGYLIHYVQDNTQPHHSTIDYKSVSYFGHRPDAPNVHSEVEWRGVDDPSQPMPELRARLFDQTQGWLALADTFPNVSEDAFEATLDVAYASYRYLPMIGRAAQKSLIEQGGKPAIDTKAFFEHREVVDGMPIDLLTLKARQQAWAILRTEAVLRAAWAAAKHAE